MSFPLSRWDCGAVFVNGSIDIYIDMPAPYTGYLFIPGIRQIGPNVGGHLIPEQATIVGWSVQAVYGSATGPAGYHMKVTMTVSSMETLGTDVYVSVLSVGSASE